MGSPLLVEAMRRQYAPPPTDWRGLALGVAWVLTLILAASVPLAP